jgi:hypothetical protein
LIEPDDGFAVNQRNRRTAITHVDKLFQGRLIGANIPIDEINAFLGKKLFLLIAWASTRLAVNNNRFGHGLFTSDTKMHSILPFPHPMTIMGSNTVTL